MSGRFSSRGFGCSDCCCGSYRDEDYNVAAKLKQLLKRESHDFLGQKIIDVRALSAVSDLWYNLGGFSGARWSSVAIQLVSSCLGSSVEMSSAFTVIVNSIIINNSGIFSTEVFYFSKPLRGW